MSTWRGPPGGSYSIVQGLDRENPLTNGMVLCRYHIDHITLELHVVCFFFSCLKYELCSPAHESAH